MLSFYGSGVSNISHLFYEDDVIFLSMERMRAWALLKVLDIYEACFGQES